MICRAKSWTEEPNSQPSRQPRNRSGYTLIEMVVVVMLIAMMAGAVVFSLRAPLQNARVKRVLSIIEDADRRARVESRRSSEIIELTIDSDNGTATQSAVSLGESREMRRALPFSGGLHIDRSFSSGRTTSDNKVTVRFGTNGQSGTYAVRLNTDRNRQDSRKAWLVVVGATGQYIRSNEDSIVESIVSMQP